MAEPRFGEWFTGIYASDENPHKHGMYVRTIRRYPGGMNPGMFYELTDGEGNFWEYPVGSVVRRETAAKLEPIVDPDDPFIEWRETVGYCSVCGEARDATYTCRQGGSTVSKEEAPG